MINLRDFEWRWWSQHGEDGIIRKIFDVVPPKHKQFVEIGAHFHEANCLRLAQHEKWKGIYFDLFHDFPPLGFYKQAITRENINSIFEQLLQNGFKADLDILSIDVDGIDFYLWSALSEKYHPQLVIVELNSNFGLDDKVIRYHPSFDWDGSTYSGASITAWMKLAEKKGYSLIYIEEYGVNAFFMRNDVIPPDTFPEINNVQYWMDQINYPNEQKMDTLHRSFVTSDEAMRPEIVVTLFDNDDDDE